MDCLDALASDRQYRRALPLDQAMEEVAKLSGKSFDPEVVAILKQRYVELERKATSQTKPMARLSTDVKVERGDAPDAGFEVSEPSHLTAPAKSTTSSTPSPPRARKCNCCSN